MIRKVGVSRASLQTTVGMAGAKAGRAIILGYSFERSG